MLKRFFSFFVVARSSKGRNTFRVGLLYGLAIAFISTLLMAMGVFHGFDSSIHAQVMQLGFKNPKIHDQVLIVKKDQATSELLAQNPGRAEFASLFRFLGKGQVVSNPNVKIPQSYALLKIELGYFQNIKDLPIKTSFSEWSGIKDSTAASGSPADNDSEHSKIDQSNWHSMSRQVREFFKANPQQSGFTSFIKVDEKLWPPQGLNALKALAGGREFLLLPTATFNWSDPARAQAMQAIADSAADGETIADEKLADEKLADEKLADKKLAGHAGNFAQQVAVLKRWVNLFDNLARSDINFELDICPRSDTFLRISMRLTVAPPLSEYLVEPADIIGFDFVLQGEKKDLLNSDQLLEAAIAQADSRIILAGHTKLEQEFSVKSQGAIEDDIALTTSKKDHYVTRHIMPNARFVKGKAEVAPIDARIGSKGYITEAPLFVINESTQKLMPTFSMKIAMLALDRQHPEQQPSYTKAMETEYARIYQDVLAQKFTGPLLINDMVIPVNSFGNMVIDFVGSVKRGDSGDVALPSVSLYECLSKDTLQQFFATMPDKKALKPDNAHNRVLSRAKKNNKGQKIILIGPFEITDFDFFPTPLTFASPFCIYKEMLMGIEIHANVLINILDRRYIKHAHPWHTLIALLLSCLLLGFILDISNPAIGILITMAFMGGACWQSYHSYHVARQLLNVSALLFSYPAIWVMATLTNYIRQKLQAKATKDMFSRFVAADVVQYMLDNPELVKPGGEKVELTIFFSDVAGFTSISEALTPEELVILLNEYLGAMTDLLFEYGGTLDKFIGDAVMAFWNFPKKQDDHALRGCLCALAMQRKINELQIGWAERGLPRVTARAGLNTAGVVVGYMGSHKAQMNFTCMGDGVNLASRLEGANKEYSTDLMISDATYQRVKHAITARFLDFLAVKGKKEPVKVFELISEIGKEPADWAELAAMYDKAIQLHLDRHWDEAIAVFEKILARWPKDGPSATYLARCQEYKQHPPPEKWDGRYILTHK